MQRMTHFVSNCEHFVQRRLIVQKHERMDAGNTCRICAATLAFGLLHIYPALVVTLFQQRLILFAEGRKSLYDIVVRIVV